MEKKLRSVEEEGEGDKKQEDEEEIPEESILIIAGKQLAVEERSAAALEKLVTIQETLLHLKQREHERLTFSPMAANVPPDLFWSCIEILFYSTVIFFSAAMLKIREQTSVPELARIVIYAIFVFFGFLILKRLISGFRYLFANRLRREKWDLINRIRAHVGQDNWFTRISCRRRPLNIAVIGTQGTGKSAFINSAIAAFNENCWEERCTMGTFASGKPVTVSNRRLEDLRTARYQAGYLMPNIIDVAGFPDEEKDKWKEVLRILFDGCLPEDVPINAAAEYYDQLGDGNIPLKEKIQNMRQRYSKEDPNMKVDRIIFVGSYMEPIRQGLIKNVLDAAVPTGLQNDPTQRGVPIFGVLTKEDLVEKGSQEAKDKRDLFRFSLGIDDSRVLFCSNYCQQMDDRLQFNRLKSVHPKLDVPILNFMCQVCNPSREDTGQDRQLLNVEPAPRRYSNFLYMFSFALNAIAISVAMFYVISIPVDGARVRAVCFLRKRENYFVSALDDLCKTTNDGQLLQPNYFYAIAVIIGSILNTFIMYIIIIKSSAFR